MSGNAFNVAGGFADDFKTADDHVLRPLVGEKLLTGHAGNMLLNNARRIEDVGEIRLIPRHKSVGPSKEWLRGDKDYDCAQRPNG